MRVAPMVCVFAAAAAVTGCGGTPDPAHPSAPERQSGELEPAALPFRILALPGGGEISWEEFVERTGEASAICVGERHSNPHDHWAQLQVVKDLVAPEHGERTALGMEMFQRPFQGVLDDYAAGRIDEETMLARTGWERRWGHDYALYRPMVETAVEGGADLVALNATRELVRKVSREGFGELTPAEHETLPELDLDDPDHQAWFWEVMDALGDAHPHGGGAGAGDPHGHGEIDGHGDGGGPKEEGEREVENERSADERLYAAQVIWDETMAEAAAEWLAAETSGRIVLLTGKGHCHDSAVVARIERRGDYDAVSVLPLIDASEGRVADLVARPRHDYLLVMTPPRGDR